MFIFNFFFLLPFFPPIGRLGLFISHQKGSFCFYSVDSVGPRECKDRRESVCVLRYLRSVERKRKRKRETEGKKVEYEGMFHLNFQLAVSVFRLY